MLLIRFLSVYDLHRFPGCRICFNLLVCISLLSYTKSFKNEAGKNKAILPPVWSDMVPCMMPISLVGPWDEAIIPM